MNTMRKIATVGAILVMTLGLSACDAKVEEGGKNSLINTFSVSFPDTTKVDCFVFNGNEAAGVRCDWDSGSSVTETDPRLLGSIETLPNKAVRCATFDGSGEGAMDCDL